MPSLDTQLEFIERLAALDPDLHNIVVMVLHSDLSIKEILNLVEGDLCVPLFTRGLSEMEKLILSARCQNPRAGSRESIFRWNALEFPELLEEAAENLGVGTCSNLYDVRRIFGQSVEEESNVISLDRYRRGR